jgi:hypothetical protein
MDQKQFQTELDARRLRLGAALEERDKLDREIAKLRIDIGSLIQLADESFVTEDQYAPLFGVKGISDACKEVLTAFTEALTVNEVLDKLKILGYNLSPYVNAPGTVQTTLKRMTEGQDPVAIETFKDGKKAYQLKAHASIKFQQFLLNVLPPSQK